MSDNARDRNASLPHDEVQEIEERLPLRAPMIYEIVRKDGERELDRPKTALFWSGLAAGVSIGFSLIAEALLHHHLPDASWRPLVENFGYTVGFLIVILARQQLFTENTITAILPLMARQNLHCLMRVARLWGIVLSANILGALLMAVALAYLGLMEARFVDAAIAVSEHFMSKPAAEMFLHGIFAGWLIASMVWLIPNAENAEFMVIVVFTYIIALGEFSHIIAGSVEAFLLLITGHIGLGATFLQFMIPTLLGNIVGGTALFALISYAQVREELEEGNGQSNGHKRTAHRRLQPIASRPVRRR